jgi:hypothetical protein
MNEIEFFQSREAEARANIQRTLSGLKKDMRAAVSPRGWVQEKPFASLLLAGSLSMALGFGAAREAKKLLAGRGEKSSRRVEKARKRSDLAGSPREARKKSSLLARGALWALRESPALALGLLRRTLRHSSPDGEAPSTAGPGDGAGPEQARVDELLGSALAPGPGAGKE